MRSKWVILAALVFLGVVGWVVVTPPKVYSPEEVRATLAGGLNPEWVIESESSIYRKPHRNILQKLSNWFLGISDPAVFGGNLYDLRNGEGRASFSVYYEGNNVEKIFLFSESMYAKQLKEQIQSRLPGIRCYIFPP